MRPKVGEAFSNSGISPGTWAGRIPDGSSRQLIAGNASMVLSAYPPSESREAYASASCSSTEPSPSKAAWRPWLSRIQ